MAADNADNLPTALLVPAQLQGRNAEYNLDLSGRVTNLDEKCLVVSFPVEIPEGTVLFTHIDLRGMNTTVRGLTRVRSQSQTSELGGYRTIADFVDLNEGERHKITRMLEMQAAELAQPQPGSEGPEEGPLQGRSAAAAPHAPAHPPRGRSAGASALLQRFGSAFTIANVIWVLLGAIFYSIVALAIIAIFPQGRAFELTTLARAARAFEHAAPALAHFFGIH